MARLIFPIILGLGGIVVLLFLGFWQLDRLGWKEGILADINGDGLPRHHRPAT